MPHHDHALLYDRDCGFCTWVTDVILRWDSRGDRRLRPVALQDPEGTALLPGLSEDQRMASFHLVGPDGAVRSGGEALAALTGLLPAGTPLQLVLNTTPGTTDRGYRWVADHRVGISRWVPSRFKSEARRRVSRFASDG
jgi:predicted DCC family thiol-disulfide oxidoreductase YuxK